MDLQTIIYGLFLAGAVYGGIRADLRHLHERTASAIESAKEAHERIDALLLREGAR